jgi:hypothetical protein
MYTATAVGDDGFVLRHFLFWRFEWTCEFLRVMVELVSLRTWSFGVEGMTKFVRQEKTRDKDKEEAIQEGKALPAQIRAIQKNQFRSESRDAPPT